MLIRKIDDFEWVGTDIGHLLHEFLGGPTISTLVENHSRFFSKGAGDEQVAFLILGSLEISDVRSEVLIAIESFPASTLNPAVIVLLIEEDPNVLLPFKLVNILDIFLIEVQNDFSHGDQKSEE